jgi:hypothetical protein
VAWIGLVVAVATSLGGPGKGPAGVADCAVSTDGRVEPPDVGVKQCFSSPDHRKTVIVDRGRVHTLVDGKSYFAGTMDYGAISWNSISTGFAIADSGGSGESNYFNYVDLRSRAPHRSTLLRKVAISRFAQIFQCSGRAFYAYAWYDGWQDASRVRLVVQAGVHSEGCHYPNLDVIEIGIVGDPATGRIDRVLQQSELQKEWCTPSERKQYGFCWTAVENGAPKGRP